MAYAYHQGGPARSYKVSLFPNKYSTNHRSQMAFYLLFSLAMSTKTLTENLLEHISQFCMFFFDPTCSRYPAYSSVREMSNPQFSIEYDDVTTYIIRSAPSLSDGPITADLLSGVLYRQIGYAPPAFIRSLVEPSADNTDLECMAVLYSLLMMDILPPSGLRMSINRILYSHNGEDLTRHLVDNLDNEARYLLESQLARIL
jgi:hypothetical protein